MRSIRDIPEQDRPREKLMKKGQKALNNTELIAAIIGKGVPGNDVLSLAKDIEGVIDNKGVDIACEDLMLIGGVGATKACQIVASLELARRYPVSVEESIVTVKKPDDILPLVEFLLRKTQEYFVCITLNGAGEVIKRRIVTKGLLNHSPVHPREVYADAITDRAASVIFVHNHPSGNPEPSRQDVEITSRLVEAGDILGIRVLDHIIVGKNGHVSLKERGLM